MPLACRFYEPRFPMVGEVVMVNVRSIDDQAARVHLVEYNNLEGMVLLAEPSRRHVRGISTLTRVGKKTCLAVMKVNYTNESVDLSKRNLSAEEIDKCEEKYARAKRVNSILHHVGHLLNYESGAQLERLYQRTAWFFDRKQRKHGACYEVFKESIASPGVLDQCKLDSQTKKVLKESIHPSLFTPQTVKMRSDIEVSCYGYEGVDAVKNALRSGLSMSTEEIPIMIKLIASPLYAVTTQTTEKSAGLQRLQEAIDNIRLAISESDGIFKIKMAPRVVPDLEELEWARLTKNEVECKLAGDTHHSSDYSDEDEMDNLGQYRLRNNLCISEIPEVAQENTKAIIVSYAMDMGVTLVGSDISKIYRVGRSRLGGKPRPIIIEFVSYQARNIFYKLAKSRGMTGYAHEHLTAKRSELLYHAREARRQDKCNWCWSTDGQIRVKLESDEVITIVKLADLIDLGYTPAKK